MQSCYVDKEHRAIADIPFVPELGDVYVLTRINVPREHRGKGIASNLLKQILADADAEKATIILEVSPSDGLNRRDLIRWYERHGFVQVLGNTMRRSPRG